MYDSKNKDNTKTVKKEYTYGQFKVIENILYFSESCLLSDKVMQSPIVKTIYDGLDSEGLVNDEDCDAKIINDTNVDFVVDSILSVCPDASQKYLDIVKQMSSY
jgi:hypothetical protein